MTCDVEKWENFPKYGFKQQCGDTELSYYQCVYQYKCCYKATTTNEPTCYRPEPKTLN
jgi:hypothetical protein